MVAGIKIKSKPHYYSSCLWVEFNKLLPLEDTGKILVTDKYSVILVNDFQMKLYSKSSYDIDSQNVDWSI